MENIQKDSLSKPSSFRFLIVPSVTVFIANFCIMALELVAGRSIAVHLGSSLYTWTSVIGVVLAGITIGNYIGGRIADKFPAKKVLAAIFGVSSIACVIIIIMDNIVGEWVWLWKLSWPVRVFSHVSIIFLLPSVLLGTISPVVAKMALEKNLAKGRTVGDIYAWGAAGSIAGTFAAGFFLIAAVGIVNIVWMIAAVLLVMGLLYHRKSVTIYICLALFLISLAFGIGPWKWAGNAGESLALRKKQDPDTIYEDETNYCHVKVQRLTKSPDTRAFIQDKLRHSEIAMGNITDLRYDYEQIHAAVTHRLTQSNDKLSTLVIGGGGYIFPRYIEKLWPKSRVDVAEIDPGVTKAAMEAFGLDKNTSINTFNIDARNYVDQLLYEENSGGQKTRYDFIYEDAINDYSVPYQLVTKEFNDKVAVLLGEEGVYLVVLIDIYNSGLFLGSYVNTLQETFSHVYIMATSDMPRSERNTFVVVAAMRELDLTNLKNHYTKKDLSLWHLDENNIAELKQKANNTILTDDFAPVENLTSPVVRKLAIDFLASKYFYQAKKFASQEKYDESLKKYQDLVELDTIHTAQAHYDMALILTGQKKITEAIDALMKALEANEKSELDIQTDSGKSSLRISLKKAGIHYNLGQLLVKIDRSEDASEHFEKAIEGFRKGVIKEPRAIKVWAHLGDALAESDKFDEASLAFSKALKLDPADPAIRIKLIRALEIQGRIDDAIDVAEKGFEVMSQMQQTEIAMKFKEFIDYLKYKKQITK